MIKKYLLNTFAVVAGAISVIVAFFNSGVELNTQGPGFWVAAVLATCAAVLLLWLEWSDFFKVRPKRYEPKSVEIKEYMRKWLNSGGRALVLSRDLTWVGSREQQVLEEKAARGELEVLVERSTAASEALSAKGATVHVYSHLGFAPKSRFTIIDYEKDGARVAIGKVRNNKHLITEHHNSDDDVFVLVNDLKNAILSSCKQVQ